MSESGECRSLKCRMARGEIPPGPFTPRQFAALGLEEPAFASPNPVKAAVNADPEVIEVRAAIAAAQTRVDRLRADWEQKCVEVAEAQLHAEREAVEASSRRMLNRGDNAAIVVNPGARSLAEAARDEARDLMDAAGKALVRLKDRERTAVWRAYCGFTEAEKAAQRRASGSGTSEPVRLSPAQARMV